MRMVCGRLRDDDGSGSGGGSVDVPTSTPLMEFKLGDREAFGDARV